MLQKLYAIMFRGSLPLRNLRFSYHKTLYSTILIKVLFCICNVYSIDELDYCKVECLKEVEEINTEDRMW